MSLAKKLEDAGIDTLGARLTTFCVDAIRQKPDSIQQAWMIVGDMFGYELIHKLMMDMQPPSSRLSEEFGEPVGNGMSNSVAPTKFEVSWENKSKPYTPRLIEPERLEKRREIKKFIQSRYHTSSGINWANVGWHELPGMDRDGMEARALIKAGPANIPNGLPKVHEVLGVKKVDEILAKVKAGEK